MSDSNNSPLTEAVEKDGGAASSNTKVAICDIKQPVTKVKFEDSLTESGYRHAVHCMLWADHQTKVLDEFESKAVVLMQMRFDGHVGFPGGIVDDSVYNIDHQQAKRVILDALLREIHEEMNFDPQLFKDDMSFESNYASTHLHPSKKLYLHFFTYKIEIEDIFWMESNYRFGADYGNEVMGLFRAPLYTMRDGYRGLPAFLNNEFIGTSRQQLCESLIRVGLFEEEEMEKVMSASNRNIKP